MMNLKKWLVKHIELCFWILAIVLLFFMNNDNASDSLCFFHWIGFNSCPGCGIGHSIHAALHLEFAKSIQAHPFGIAAVLIIFYRIKQLSFPPKQLVS